MPFSYEKIEEQATSFLETYNNPERKIPIPIETIIEIKLNISIVPMKGLLEREQIDAFLAHDCTIIYIDEDHYMNQTNRSRFTLAHEIGHYVMHRSIIERIKSLEDWRTYVLGAGTQRAILETEANNFAGCLLMPKPEILNEYNQYEKIASKQLSDAGLKISDQKILISYIANKIAKKFEVSEQAAEIRLSKVLKDC